MRIAALAGREVDTPMRRALAALDPSAPTDSRELAALLVSTWCARSPSRVGLAGGQGAGKSTLARLLEQAGHAVGLRIGVVSLDDFYLSLAERRRLARTLHPLFVTRGPPGTHDVEACRAALGSLGRPGRTALPVFDKGLDDRHGRRFVEGPLDVVVLEGWCVGAGPGTPSELARPINRLEREEDPQGLWRGAVERALAGPYARLFGELDSLVFLRVPDLDAVRRWRLEQESQRPPAQRLDAPAIDRFVAHFERITLRMRTSLPGKADLTIDLAPDHSIAGVAFRVP